MAENNARIHQEMRDADALRADMRQSVLDRVKDQLGKVYDNAFTREVVSGLHDFHRRAFEQGYFGHDVLDGRWAMDRPKGQEQATAEMGKGYSQAHSFYGYDHDHQDREHDLDLGR